MTECMTPVTGTGSIVGFTNPGYNHHYDRYGDHCGISDKDQGYQAVVDAGERTRDVLHGQRFSDNVSARQHSETRVAIERTGAAGELATEKVGAAALLAGERNTSDLRMQAERNNLAQTQAMSDMRLEQQKQACEIQAKIDACCCRLEARMSEIESNRIRDDLAQCRAELLAAQR